MPRIPGHRTPAPIRDPATGCLVWQGAVDRNGYPRRGTKWAHRVAWSEANGRPVPPGHEVDHVAERCARRPLCVEPAHLEAVTIQEHLARRRPPPERCHRGHNDWYHRRDGKGRVCRACKRERERAKA